ncbi:hypothetical protein, partial [Escherichia coli]|uniref:hypothetical protein n=1 Tax=Escherichia coli TaxID=562 RepID=UPI001FCF0721
IICHQLNTKNNIISGSEVSRLSVAIQRTGREVLSSITNFGSKIIQCSHQSWQLKPVRSKRNSNLFLPFCSQTCRKAHVGALGLGSSR